MFAHRKLGSDPHFTAPVSTIDRLKPNREIKHSGTTGAAILVQAQPSHQASACDQCSDVGVGSQLRGHTAKHRIRRQKQLGSDPNITGQQHLSEITIRATRGELCAPYRKTNAIA